MATPHYGNPIQDMPPKGGFKPVKFSRGNPTSRGPPGWLSLSAVTFFIAYGFYRVGQSNIKIRQNAQEMRERRISILPFLQAEEDVRFSRNQVVFLQDEKKTMKHVSNWKVNESPYNNPKRWVTPLYVPTEK